MTASFTITHCTVTFETDGTTGTALTGNLIQSLDAGQVCTEVQAQPATGYLFASWTKNGVEYSPDNPFTVTKVTEDMNMLATFGATKPSWAKSW